MSGENDDIVVTGSRYQPILEEWRAQQHTIDEEGVGGAGIGGGGQLNQRIRQSFQSVRQANVLLALLNKSQT